MVTLEIIFIVLLTVLNGVFAMSEIAVVSARKARLQQRSERGDRKARLALDLANAPEEFLSTVQVGITLVGVLAGALGGATIAEHLAVLVERQPLLAPYAETISVAAIVLAITYLSLILGELVPKRIALTNPEKIASMVAGPIGVLSRVTRPVVWTLSASAGAILWLLRVKRNPGSPVTEDEIRILIRQATTAGVFHRDEQEILERAFRLSGRRVSTIMTPRAELVVLYTSDTPEILRKKVEKSGFSLYPVCENTLDDVLGVVRVQDLLVRSLEGGGPDLRSALRQPLFLPESISSLKLLEEFRKTGKDTAVILNEFGGLQGLVTATDLLKALTGGVSHLSAPAARLQPDGSWLVDGLLAIEEFKDALRLGELPREAERSYETVGGFVIALLGRIPAEGESVDWGGFTFTVVDMDGLRLDKVRITRPGGPPGEPGGTV